MPVPSFRPPCAGDPIRSSVDALAVVSCAVRRPLVHETIAFFLDEASRSDTLIIVSDTVHDDAVYAVAECMLRVGNERAHVCGLVLATVRPNHRLRPGDTSRFHELELMAEDCGIELVEWFIVGPGGVESPRDLLGLPERW